MDMSLAGGGAGSWCTWEPISNMPALTGEVGSILINEYINVLFSLKLENIFVLLLLNSFSAVQVRLPFGEELPLLKAFESTGITISSKQNSTAVD